MLPILLDEKLLAIYIATCLFSMSILAFIVCDVGIFSYSDIRLFAVANGV